MSPEEYVTDHGGTELTLALPGTPRKPSDSRQMSGNKRRFFETNDSKLGEAHINNYNSSNTNGRVVGWPPVRIMRRKYVKVAVDGAPYLRKVDLEMYDCYGKLLTALGNMFQVVITTCKVSEIERKVVHVEFLATYEDKDGDWMLVGDVPWMMFVESCKRMRLMKIVDAIGPKLKRINVSNSREVKASDLPKSITLLS